MIDDLQIYNLRLGNRRRQGNTIFMEKITISQKDNERSGVFKAKNEDGKTVGQMTYEWADDNNILIDHTEVSPFYEGEGIGSKLVLQAVEFARRYNIKIMPLCQFAKAEFARHPEYNDVTP